MKGSPWGWNRPYFKALLPFPRAVFGFCSPWAETPTGKLPRTLQKSHRQKATKCVPIVRRPPPGSEYCLLKAARTYRPMKASPWGWNRPYFKALLPFPRAVFGFCSPWAEPPRGYFFAHCGEVTNKDSKILQFLNASIFNAASSSPLERLFQFRQLRPRHPKMGRADPDLPEIMRV